jgi:hypothetical protein
VAKNLLVHGDRWAAKSTNSRDLVDLAVLKQRTDFPQAAIDKAKSDDQS